MKPSVRARCCIASKRRIPSILVASPLAELLGRKSADKCVPEFVWRGDADAKQAFLQALFEGDGCVSYLGKNTIQISYSTRSEQLARDVQDLLLEFGVICRRVEYSKRRDQARHQQSPRRAHLRAQRRVLGGQAREAHADPRLPAARSRRATPPTASRSWPSTSGARAGRGDSTRSGWKSTASTASTTGNAAGTRSSTASPRMRSSRSSPRWSRVAGTSPPSSRSPMPACNRSIRSGSIPTTTRSSPPASSTTTRNHGWRRWRCSCWGRSTKTPSTSPRPTTATPSNRWCSPRGSRTSWSTGEAGSPSAWRRTSRRTTSARSSTRCSTCSTTPRPRSRTSCSS